MAKETSGTWREQRRRSARDAIIDAAWTVVREEGLAGLSMRDLAQRAGISTPTVYAYFSSKHDVYDALFAQGAAQFSTLMADRVDTGDPVEALTSNARRFINFCTSDVPRYQLLFQKTIPGFMPSAESYAHALSSLELARATLAENGVTEPRHLDMWTAIITGLVDQQVSNDPGGQRWLGLIEEVVTMFLTHCQTSSRQQPRTTRPARTKEEVAP